MLVLGGKVFNRKAYVAGLPAIFLCFTEFYSCLFLSVLQEESSMKPEEPGPRSRFGPSTEDLTSASKQVNNANRNFQGPPLVLFYECAYVWWELGLITETFFQDVITISHSQAPQKPIRRKYNPESQNPETVPPPSIPFPPPAKPAQKLVKSLTYELTFQQNNVAIIE